MYVEKAMNFMSIISVLVNFELPVASKYNLPISYK